ncbi:mismatch repair endonuclease pms2-like [Stylonychia lemnae]|uniref:Mismatch repair endonuclease pms2-like n=1 Tax=Stylonychia lemnae TaxID=5949 RepID=A0A078A956_STYLE|nr:mismatch repair endonuclease pms2-like [Stylonychia lemnae]|eukprot:CDW77338.1 mismatch repair endonuclease pms2-like [Stylonychia lemnae]
MEQANQGDIKRIDKASILQICSSQVVIDLKSAVKELVENSLDAESTSIDIKFYNYGLNGFEVIDDGHGIKEVDFDVIAKRGTTSKINEFEDIYAVKSLGFRGEALSSLCNIANVTIQTKRPDQNTGWLLKFNHLGDVIQKEQVAKQDGTSVIVKDLFKDLPVRMLEFKKNYKTQYAKTLLQLQGPFTSILRTNPLQDNSDKALANNIITVLGKPKFQQLIEFKADLPKVKVTSFITKTVLSGSMNNNKINKDFTFFYLNKRPIDMPRKFKQLFSEIYKIYNPSTNPIIVMNIDVEDNNYDINVSPDKRDVFLKNEEDVIQALRIELQQFFENIQRTKAYDSFQAPQSQRQSQLILGSKSSNDSKTKSDQQSDGNRETLSETNWIQSKRRVYDDISNDNYNHQDAQSEQLTPNKHKLEGKTITKSKQSFQEWDGHSDIKVLNTIDRQQESFNRQRECTPLIDTKQYLERLKTVTSQKFQSDTSKKFQMTTYEPKTVLISKNNQTDNENILNSNQIQTSTKTLASGLKLTEYIPQLQKQTLSRGYTITEFSLPEFPIQKQEIDITEDSQRSKAENLMQKMQDFSDRIMNGQQYSQNDKQQLSQDDQFFNKCMDDYSKKLAMEKEKILNAEAQMDMNTDLRNFESAVKNQLRREKLILQYQNENNDDQFQEESFQEIIRKQLNQLKSSQEITQQDSEQINVITNSANLQMDEKTLQRMFKKEDFKTLRVIGQFNKGFIMSVLNEEDLFILDQHACDEKYNFEKYSRTSVIDTQDLINPIQVELSVTDALAIKLHKEVFKMNGFKVEPKESDDEMNNLFLIKSLPLIKKANFTVDDFDKEQSYQAKEGMLHKEIMRPSKIYANLASRACRTSIMVGTDLDQQTMKKVVNNLATLESPWNCPHGRPTMRFLKKLDLNSQSRLKRQPPNLLRN